MRRMAKTAAILLSKHGGQWRFHRYRWVQQRIRKG